MKTLKNEGKTCKPINHSAQTGRPWFAIRGPSEQFGNLSLGVGDARQAKLDPGLQQLFSLCARLSNMDIAFSSYEGSGESAHAYAQTQQRYHCSHTQSLGVDRDAR